MLEFSSELNWVLQGLIATIIIGVFYNLYESSKIYGGLIGSAIRWLGVGIMFIAVSVIEKVLFSFGIIQVTTNLALIQDGLILMGLFFLALGFSKLASAGKAN